jgi:hypothetical protein
VFLVATNKRDLTADLIIIELKRRQLATVRLNTEDLADGSVEIHPTSSKWRLQIGGRACSDMDVEAAYFRRPEPVKIPSAVREDCRLYSAMEWQSLLEGLYFALNDKWLNAPHHISAAENKIKQLAFATRLGFRVPPTLITNNPRAVKDFCTDRSVIGKPLRQALLHLDGAESVVFTTRVRVDDATDPQSVTATPFIVLEEVPKRFDVRVTVVGERVFAATIDSQSSPETQVDWRRSSRADLQHQTHSLPKSLEMMCVSLTRALGLRFGAIDLVLDTSGEYWFLEINPNGQWGWIQVRTGYPIASAIVDELVKIAATERAT